MIKFIFIHASDNDNNYLSAKTILIMTSDNDKIIPFYHIITLMIKMLSLSKLMMIMIFNVYPAIKDNNVDQARHRNKPRRPLHPSARLARAPENPSH